MTAAPLSTRSPLLALLHLSDTLFPIGAFGYSDGLEAAAARGEAPDGQGLERWLEIALLETIERSEGPAALESWTAFREGRWQTLVDVDAELAALRPAAALRRSSRAMGLRLLATWHTLYPDARLERLLGLARDGRLGPALPVAFAAACASADVDDRATLEAFAYTRLAATLSAALRLVPVGQREAHLALARALERVPRAVEAVVARRARPESFTPMLDIAAMSHQYLHTRLFRS